MKEIERYKGIFKGRELAILCNGVSLTQDIPILREERIPTIGLNSSWRVAQSNYHLALDNPQLTEINQGRPIIKYLFRANWPSVFTPGYNIIDVPTRMDRKVFFSTDVSKVAYICMSSTWFALQLAYYFTEGNCDIYLCGYDLGGKRITGHVMKDADLPQRTIQAQLETMGYLRALIDNEIINPNFKVFITSPTCSCRSIPSISLKHREEMKKLAYLEKDSWKVVHRYKERKNGGKKNSN